MNNKRRKENNQLSLALEPPSHQAGAKADAGIAVTDVHPAATILAFPSRQVSAVSFRERVIQDLIRNHVMVD